MELLQFIKDEGYTEARFVLIDGKGCCLNLHEIYTNDQFLHHLKLVPTLVHYFPLEREPYIECIENERTMKIKLIKGSVLI
ncbi:hypothetical protein [Halobacillus sp. BBL2006]|uniref:hypothetical protein n=1 Tax=Halobacillus sp. BBL2006 TaxID=1543706 RepID=UPI0005424F9D|nr:hypothetical protein [Halobacillus sp. BBL2006]KHE67327.1 hypothetical protein LD39_18130 [Halobacillus sp. BBL2006]